MTTSFFLSPATALLAGALVILLTNGALRKAALLGVPFACAVPRLADAGRQRLDQLSRFRADTRCAPMHWRTCSAASSPRRLPRRAVRARSHLDARTIVGVRLCGGCARRRLRRRLDHAVRVVGDHGDRLDAGRRVRRRSRARPGFPIRHRPFPRRRAAHGRHRRRDRDHRQRDDRRPSSPTPGRVGSSSLDSSSTPARRRCGRGCRTPIPPRPGRAWCSSRCSRPRPRPMCCIRAFPGTELLIWIGLAMAVYGIVYAALENDIRRLIAFAIVSQMGFKVAGVGIGTPLALNGVAAHSAAAVDLYRAPRDGRWQRRPPDPASATPPISATWQPPCR